MQLAQLRLVQWPALLPALPPSGLQLRPAPSPEGQFGGEELGQLRANRILTDLSEDLIEIVLMARSVLEELTQDRERGRPATVQAGNRFRGGVVQLRTR